MLLREHRKLHQLTQERTAALGGLGSRFISELERGKESAEIGKALQLIQRLGLELWLLPRGVPPETK